MNNNNGGPPTGYDMPDDKTGTFPVAVALQVKNLTKFIKHMQEAVKEDDGSTLMLYFNRKDIALRDSKGVLTVIITLD